MNWEMFKREVESKGVLGVHDITTINLTGWDGCDFQVSFEEGADAFDIYVEDEKKVRTGKMGKIKKLPPGTYQCEVMEGVKVAKDGWLEVSFRVGDGDFEGRIIKTRIPVAGGRRDESDIAQETEIETMSDDSITTEIRDEIDHQTREDLITIYNLVTDSALNEDEVEWDRDRE